ncbi:hypothetical protein B0O80DRAFT_33404 [Mortierella sp. GBAus27b]|nr:hypothetical protein B0O80DRAFT_33404 [Mortierella sp. GBAus27b]
MKEREVMIGKNGAKVLSCADMIKSLLDWECQNSLALAQWEICPGNAKWKTRKPLVPAACCLCSISEIGSHNGCQWLLALAGGRLTNIHAFPGSAGKSLSINECCTPSLPVYLSHSSIMSLESLHVHLRNACLLRHDESITDLNTEFRLVLGQDSLIATILEVDRNVSLTISATDPPVSVSPVIFATPWLQIYSSLVIRDRRMKKMEGFPEQSPRSRKDIDR